MAGGSSLLRRQQLRQIVSQRRQPRGDFPLPFARLKQLVRDVERRQDRRLVDLDDRPLAQHLLQRLIDVPSHLTRVLRRQVGANGVLLPTDHHLDRVLLGAHLASARRPPFPPAAALACSSRKVSRCSSSPTRARAASTRRRSTLFSDSRSPTRPRNSGSGRDAAPPRGCASFKSDSALSARARQPATSSVTTRRIASSSSSARLSALSPTNIKLSLQRPQRFGERPLHVFDPQRPRRIPEHAVPGDAARPRRYPCSPVLVKDLQSLQH